MKLGIFAKTFVRPGFADAFSAVKAHGLQCLQFNFSCAGLPTLPDSIELTLLQEIRVGLSRWSLDMAAVSGTCNLIHPEPERRAKNLRNLQLLIRGCRALGTRVVTLCTGTRDAFDMWRGHPENQSREAWRDLVKALEQLLPVAQECSVALGVEPEPSNVIDTAPKARKLLDEMKSPCLKIVFDAANLVNPGTLTRQRELFSNAIGLLGEDIVLAHAKDLTSDPGSVHVAPGKGALDYTLYLSLLKQSGFEGPLIMHGLEEGEVASATAFLKARLELPPDSSTRATHALF
jgi:sugar phosphate isomerase/epimerase